MTEQPTQELLEQVCSLMEQGRFKEVLAIHDELFERFQILNDEGIFRTLAALDEVSRRVGGSSGAAERKLVIGVLLRKGWLFELTQQHEQALTACDELLQHVGGESDVTLLHHVSQMLFFKASALSLALRRDACRSFGSCRPSPRTWARRRSLST